MPAFKSKLSPTEIQQVAAFVSTAAGTGRAGKISWEPNDQKVEDCTDKACFEQAFGNLAYNEGPKKALEELDKLSATNGTVAADCHPSGTACYRVTMTLNNLNNFNPAGGQDTDTNVVWLTQWLVQSSTDSVGGRNFFAYAESTNGGALSCFDGDAGTQRIGGGLTLTYPGRIAITAAAARDGVKSLSMTLPCVIGLVFVILLI